MPMEESLPREAIIASSISQLNLCSIIDVRWVEKRCPEVRTVREPASALICTARCADDLQFRASSALLVMHGSELFENIQASAHLKCEWWLVMPFCDQGTLLVSLNLLAVQQISLNDLKYLITLSNDISGLGLLRAFATKGRMRAEQRDRNFALLFLSLATDVAANMATPHSHGIVHGDLTGGEGMV